MTIFRNVHPYYLVGVVMVTIWILAGCSTLGLESPQGFRDQLAYGYSQATGARLAAADALGAKTISADRAAQVLEVTDRARQGLDLARSAHELGQAADASSRLKAALALVNDAWGLLPQSRRK